MTKIWYWRKRLGGRKGQRCRIVVAGKMNTVLIEFEDGKRFTTSGWGLRKA